MIDPWSVVAGMMLVGFIISVPIAAFQGVPARLHGDAWLWLGLSGGGNVVGLVVGYYAYRRGELSLVVPVISTEGAVAALIAIFAGESLSPAAGVALLLAATGVCIASIPTGGTKDGPIKAHLITIGLAFSTALVFGVSLYATGRASAILPAAWVVPSARVIGVAVITIPLAVTGRLRITRRAAPFVVASGICEVVGFFAYSFGTRHGIAVAAVLSSQFAAITVAAAYFLFGERLTRLQLAGICTIIVGVSLLSAVNT